MEIFNDCHVRRIGEGVLLTYRLGDEFEAQELAWVCRAIEEGDMRERFRRIVEAFVEADGSILERLRNLGGVVSDGAVVVVDREVVWIAGKEAELRLVRDGRVIRMSLGQEWEVLSGLVQHGDDVLVTLEQHVLDEVEDWEEFCVVFEDRVDEGVVVGGWWRWGSLDRMQVEEMIESASEDEYEPVDVVRPKLAVDSRSGPSMWSKALGGVVKRLPREEAIYVLQDKVEAAKPGRGRVVFVVLAILLLVVLAGSVGYGVWTRKDRVFEENFGTILSEVDFKLDESVSLANLNPLRSEALLTEVENLILQLESRGLAVEQLQQLRQQLRQAEGVVKGEFAVEPVPWLRLSLVRENLKMVDWTWNGERMVGMDGEEARVISVDLSKSPDVLAGRDAVGQGRWVASGDLGTVVVNDVQVVRLPGGDRDAVGYDLQAEWGKILDVEMFGSSVYLLSSSGIWKLSFEGEQLVADEWIRDDELKGIVAGTRMAIDGQIWVANGGEVRRFIQGREDPYAIANLETELGTVQAIFTDEESSGLYLLDSTNKRVVVVEKETGIYKAEYQWEGLSGVLSMVVKESEGKMWWMGEEEIWEVRLQDK